MLTAAQRRTVARIDADLARLVRYDDESVVHDIWIRQRYDCGCYPTYGPARQAVVRTAWHEAGHAVAALAIGAQFSSASIHHGRDSEGRVHRIRGAADRAFIIDAAGQIAERLYDWTMLERDDELARWLPTWRGDGGDARHFRRSIPHQFGTDEIAAWRHSEAVLVPLRPRIRRLARALLVHPRHLPYSVAAVLAEPGLAGSGLPMPTYALLILPSTNRVYADSAVALTQAELAMFSEAVLGGRLTGLAQRLIGGVSYVTFDAEALGDADVAFLSNLSSTYALFVLTDGALRPVELSKLARFDDDLITIQKYQGKTNEQFTKLLVNATLLWSAFAAEMTGSKLALLDPVCGRGTTLNQALMYGWDAAGIDIDGKDFDAYKAFITTWCKRKRIKHHAETAQVRRDRHVVARRFTITLAAVKGDYKAGLTQRVDVVNADTVRAQEFFRAESFHLLVADLPYGVQHGSRTAGKRLARSPLDLLASAVPVWSQLLKPGGALGISLNTFVARREAAARIVADYGLHIADSGPYLRCQHRVDQAISRDILVARKP